MRKTLHELLFVAATRWPDKRALRTRAGDWTFAELADAASDVAAWCKKVGVESGDRVLFMTRNSAKAIAALFGVLARGAVIVPIHPETPAEGLRHYFEDAEPTALVLDDSVESPAASVIAERPVLKVDQSLPTESWPSCRSRRQSVLARTFGDEIAALLYTSGSTGPARAVVCPHGAMRFATSSIGQVLRYRHNDAVLCAIPLSFDYGLYQLFLAFAVGAEVVVEPDLKDVHLLPALLAKYGVTVLPGMPSVFALLLRSRLLDRTELSSLRLITSTGDHLAAALVEWLAAAVPSASIAPMYGLTECKRVSIRSPADGAAPHATVGKSIPGTSVRVVDGHGETVQAGASGELLVRGPHMMAGYWNAPSITAERFVQGNDGGRELRTGDVFRQDVEGYLFFEGRADSVIKCLGHRVGPAQVETTLMGSQLLREVAVVGIPDSVRGQQVVAVAVVLNRASEKELREHCRRRLVPSACPTRYVFVQDTLPKTCQGKIDRDQVRALAQRKEIPA